MKALMFLILLIFSIDAIAESAEIAARIGANLRRTPNGRKIGALPKGTRVEILPDSTQDWFHVKLSNGTKGWVYYRGFGRRPSVSDQSDDVAPSEAPDSTDTTTSDVSLPSERLYTMYRYPVAGSGQCMPALSESAHDILKRNGIGHDNGKHTDREVNALAKGIRQVERLLGRPIPRAWRTNYNYVNASGKWSQRSNGINVRRPAGSSKGENVARLMHELGHKIGNTGEYRLYRNYVDGKKCNITGYAMSKWNDQFSEVFSAYVTYPDLLKARCPKAFRFFSTKLFPGSSDRVATCQSGSDNSVNGQTGDGEPSSDGATR